MLNQPIQEVDRRLRQLVAAIYQKPEIPRELVQELHLVAMRLTAHVVELGHQKRKLNEAWAELEHL